MKVIKFEKDGCMPCAMVQGKLDDMGIEVEKVNAFENPSMAGQFDISSVPTLIVVDDNGDEVKRSIGFKPEEIEEIADILS